MDSVSSTNTGLFPEALIDERLESDGFVRLVPRTDAEFAYDKFNRLRLRNKNVLVSEQTDHDQSMANVAHTNHLRDQTVRFTVHLPSVANLHSGSGADQHPSIHSYSR